MDRYFRRDDEELIMPCDQEASGNQQADDRSPYPNGWLQWEVGRTKYSTPPNMFLSMSMEPIGTGVNSNWHSLYENMDMQSSILDGEGSSNQSAYGDFSLVDNSARTFEASFYDEKIDDFWESTFVEDPPIMNGLSNSCDSAYKSTSFGNLLTDMLMDPHDSPDDSSIMGSTVPKASFSPLIDDLAEDEDQLDDVSPSLTAETSRSPDGSPMKMFAWSDAYDPSNFQASVLSVLAPAEQTTSAVVSHVQEQKYLETTVLQELEDVTSQLNVETRICLRDALYRLAKISKKRHSFIKNRPSSDVVGEKS
ncbi:hypothetical protein Taro_024294 [Colocasia esculenta]|uniref:Uncharacterized protein n=1 Tax=Colocasia esculenta TaxID=4460 RepID=A0A843VAX9_COLES|nr:hypothetical protein [Colocasia esculenta]